MGDAATSPLFDETEKLVLRYAEASTRTIRIDDALYAALAARLPQRELVELSMTVGLAALVNRVHATFRTDVDEDTVAAVGEYSCPIGK